MKVRVADYIALKMAEAGIKTVFSVVGGGAMNLNDAFGHSKDIKVVYNHHEQACAMAAECYARVNNEMSGCVVTTGPGGLNTLNGVAGAYIDSIPMVIISGQVRWDSFSLSTGLPLRAMGDQEFNIVDSVKNMTKYAVILKDKNDVRFVMEKALYLANHGRKGPVWIDVPGDIQSAQVEVDELTGYDYTDEVYPEVKNETLDFVIDKLKKAKRPVIYAGSAIRISGAYDEFKKLINKIGAPVVTAWNALDDIETDHELFAGRPGNFGDRYGNFTVQNSDCILSLGCRLSIRQTGFNYAMWAPNAFVMMVDIDEAELKKPTIHVEYPIHSELLSFIKALNNRLDNENKKVCDCREWLSICKKWKEDFPIVPKKFYEQKKIGNAYAIIDMLSKKAPENMICVSSNGTACVVGGQAYFVKKGTRFLENSSMASMGYGLPASIGACFANGKKPLICLEGDGSIQMNIQELQVMVHHKLPIKIIIFNNDGYHSIRQSQSNFFKDRSLCGVGPDSSDLSFPDMKKISKAYGIKFTRCKNNKEFERYMEEDFNNDTLEIVEVMVDHTYFQPKAGSKKLEDGSMVSAPLEDLAPYLDREVLKEVMKVSK